MEYAELNLYSLQGGDEFLKRVKKKIRVKKRWTQVIKRYLECIRKR